MVHPPFALLGHSRAVILNNLSLFLYFCLNFAQLKKNKVTRRNKKLLDDILETWNNIREFFGIFKT